MKLIVGLGNPGKEYGDTRHNVGQMVIDAFYARHRPADGGEPEKKFDAMIWRLKIGDEKAVLL